MNVCPTKVDGIVARPDEAFHEHGAVGRVKFKTNMNVHDYETATVGKEHKYGAPRYVNGMPAHLAGG